MSLIRSFIALLFTALLAAPAAAQQNQTIQLPTFAFTTVSTTVSVPDRGQALLGGISRSSAGRTQRGTPLLGGLPFVGRPFNNVAIGSQLSGGNMSVTATIHDFQAMDQALLAEAAARRTGGIAARPGYPARRLVGLNPAAASVAEIADRQAAAQQQPGDEIEDLLQRARQAEAKGKPKVAKIFYRMISRDATGELRRLALNKLDALSGEPSRIAASARP